MKILIVLTSHDQLGNTGKKTGFWLEELAAPYYVFLDAGAEINLASPLGGQAPLDPKSDQPDFQTEATKRFQNDAAAKNALANTLKLSSVSPENFDAVFYPGGHGPLWDLAEDPNSIKLIETTYTLGKPVASVCHGPAVLLHAKTNDGSYLVKDKSVTSFTNSEEAQVELTDVVPFLVEDELVKNGANFSRAEDWMSYCVTDANLITGQNPASSEAVAKAVLQKLSSL